MSVILSRSSGDEIILHLSQRLKRAIFCQAGCLKQLIFTTHVCRLTNLNINSANLRPDRIQPPIDILVAAIDLVILWINDFPCADNAAISNATPGTNIRRTHFNTSQLIFTLQSDDGSTVRIAEDDLSTHVDKLVDKEQAALKHLLMDEHTTSRLYSHDQDDTHEVRCKARPWRIIDREDRTINKRLDLIDILRRHHEIIILYIDRYP